MRKPRSAQSHCLKQPRTDGFALTLTLIIVALATIVVIAFLTTTTTERTSAAAYGRITKARQMAEAGVDAGIARLVTEMKYRPHHAIGYRSVSNGLDTEILPIITGPRTTTPATVPTYNSAPNPAEDVYLISVSGSSAPGIPGSSAPASFTTANSIDLNANRIASEPRGWIGSPTTASTPLPFRAPWIDVLSDPSRAPQPDPSQASTYNPVIGRYAYWIEDETSKLDASIVGNQENAGAFRRGDGVNRPDLSPPKLAVNDLDIGALPLIAGLPLPTNDTATNRSVLDLRATIPMPDARFLNRVGGQVATDVHETTKFYSTSFSLSDDLAGNGRRRANINALVTSPASGAAVAPGTIAGNLDDIAYVISGKHLIASGLGPPPSPDSRVFKTAPDNYTGALANFGTRFFSPTPNPDQQRIYLERIAANIRDYIDTDQQPTYVDASDRVQSGAPVALAWKSGTEPRALGKEAIPYLQEHGWASVEVSMTGTATTRPRDYSITTDEYLEFFNATTKDFIAPAGTSITISKRPSWDAGSFGSLDLPDMVLDVSGQTFPAGRATVVTTAPASADPPGLLLNSNNVIRITTAVRTFNGRTDQQVSSHGWTPVPYGLKLRGRSGSSGISDYATEFVWGTAQGVFDAHAFLGFGGSSNSHTVWDYRGADIGNRTRFVYTASLRGNDQSSRTGDARTLSEQLEMLGGVASFGNDQTRFFGNIDGDGNVPNTATLGQARISFVDPTATPVPALRWPDYNPPFADTNATAYSVLRDGGMQSIGELGAIYDPHRVIAASNGTGNPPPSILQSRGGGRTLMIGQPDDLIAGAPRFSPSWFNSAWRLADLFAANPVANPATAAAPGEMVALPTSRGKININGVLRDTLDASGNLLPAGSGGLAFRAALRSFNFLASPNSDPQLNGQALRANEVDTLVLGIATYLKNNGPMMERGELSQLPFFATGTAGNKSLSTANDRGREEIFRRMVEMVTTRSASFTVYAIGEAVRQNANGTIVTVSQKRLANTFQLEPQGTAGPLANSTVPEEVVSSYRVRKIYAPQ